jgi:hypothetical protein
MVLKYGDLLIHGIMDKIDVVQEEDGQIKAVKSQLIFLPTLLLIQISLFLVI